MATRSSGWRAELLAFEFGFRGEPRLHQLLPRLLVGPQLLDGHVEVEVGVELLETVVEFDGVASDLGQRLGRLVSPPHGAGIQGVDAMATPPVGHQLGLLVARWGQTGIGGSVTAIDPKG
jgi:hypothetical protein